MAWRLFSLWLCANHIMQCVSSQVCYTQPECSGGPLPGLAAGEDCCGLGGRSLLDDGNCTTCSDPDTPCSKGTTFLVAFMQNIFLQAQPPDAYIMVATSERGEVEFSVTTMFGGVESKTAYQVNSTQPTRVNFQPDDVYVTNIRQRDKAIWVQARNEKISIFVMNDVFRSTDGFVALPCDAMKVPSDFRSYQYLILSTSTTVGAVERSSQFLIITCEDATNVMVTPSTRLRGQGTFQHTVFGPGTARASSTWRIGSSTALPARQTLLVTATGDLTGTLVTGNRPLVVIAGHQCGQVPGSITTCDHIAVQIPPHTAWGPTFLLSPLSGRQSGDFYRFGTQLDDTEITITCVDAGGGVARIEYYSVLNAPQGSNWGQFQTHSEACGAHTPKYCYLESSKPVIVAQYSYGNGRDKSCNGGIGDPFISVIPPIAQYLNSFNLVPVNVTSGPVLRRYVTVSVPATYFQPSQILLDDDPFEQNATLWQLIYCTDGEVCGYALSKPLDNDAHVMYHVNSTAAILVHTYGFLVGNSYALVGGMGLRAISGTRVSCTIPDGCVEEGDSLLVTCTRSLDLKLRSRVQVSLASGTATAPSDYSPLRLPRRPNFNSDNVLNFRGGSREVRELSFHIQILADSDDTEPVETFFIDVSPVRNAIIATPRVQVDICQECQFRLRSCLINETYRCIPDLDRDCIANDQDNCRMTRNSDQMDTDGDGVGDVCDNCVLTANPRQLNNDGDLAGLACDADDNDESVEAILGVGNVTVSEDAGKAQVCVTVESPSIECPIDIPFDVSFVTFSDSAVSPADFTASEATGELPVCTTSLCVDIVIKDDTTLEKEETFYVLVMLGLGEEVFLPNITLTQEEATVSILDNDDGVVVELADFPSEYIEDGVEPEICAVVTTNNTDSDCVVGFFFEVILSFISTTSESAGEDVANTSLILSFAPCQERACVAPNIINDNITEEPQQLLLMLERTAGLDQRIAISGLIRPLLIIDDDEMSVGFMSKTFTGTEMAGFATVCVQVFNPPTGGALKPFNITILPEEGAEVSNQQYTLECSRKLEFEKKRSVVCHNYKITPDNDCELREKATHFVIRLSLTFTDGISIDRQLSHARVTIDDSQELECYVEVGYREVGYTISEVEDSVEVCVTSSSPGIAESFTINVTTNNTISMNTNTSFIKQSSKSLNFSVNHTHPSQRECYNISADFGVDGDICEVFNCSKVEFGMDLVLVEDAARVHLSRSSSLVAVELPSMCRCAHESPSPTSSSASQDNTVLIIATTVISLIVVLALAVIILLIVLFCQNKKKLKKVNLEEYREGPSAYDNTYISLDEKKRSFLSEQLKQQLKDKRMIFPKSQLELSSTVGQGESGLVYKGYLNTAIGKEIVAVKTGKALFSTSDMERLAKEVATMLSFEHTNVMSLVGVCLDGDMPLLIMPFMSNGCVLEFVKHHKEELLCINATEPQVQSATKSLLNICHQITKGMEYLALQKFVHRDLAARNCMIDRNGVIKVADFGLTEDMYGTNYFRRRKSVTGSEEKVPIRWMAPESIENDIYTEDTDVWSFGVTVWEIFTCGRTPFTGIPAMSLLNTLQGGQRLEKPDNEACTDEVYEIMLLCWSLEAKDRPHFEDLEGMISSLLERESGYLELSQSQSLCWKEESPLPPSPTGLPAIEEEETVSAEVECEDKM